MRKLKPIERGIGRGKRVVVYWVERDDSTLFYARMFNVKFDPKIGGQVSTRMIGTSIGIYGTNPSVRTLAPLRWAEFILVADLADHTFGKDSFKGYEGNIWYRSYANCGTKRSITFTDAWIEKHVVPILKAWPAAVQIIRKKEEGCLLIRFARGWFDLPVGEKYEQTQGSVRLR